MATLVTNYSHFNTTSITQSKDFHLKTSEIIFVILYLMIFVLGVGGNILVVKSFSAPNSRKKAGSKLVISLAVNDLFASILVPLTQIHSIVSRNTNPVAAWFLGKTLCYTIIGFSYIFLLATGWLLVSIAIERFR